MRRLKFSEDFKAGMATLMNQAETTEDQQYICHEFKRANSLLRKLSKRQQEISVRKIELEKAIMAARGVNDGEMWVELRSLRAEIDAHA